MAPPLRALSLRLPFCCAWNAPLSSCASHAQPPHHPTSDFYQINTCGSVATPLSTSPPARTGPPTDAFSSHTFPSRNPLLFCPIFPRHCRKTLKFIVARILSLGHRTPARRMRRRANCGRAGEPAGIKDNVKIGRTSLPFTKTRRTRGSEKRRKREVMMVEKEREM